MQNDAKRPSGPEFGQMIAAIQKRIRRDSFDSNGEYALKLMEVGIGLSNPHGKDAILVILGSLAMVASSQAEDASTYLNVIANEVKARSLYDKDYETMLQFMNVVMGRGQLTTTIRTDDYKEKTSTVLEKYYPDLKKKENGDGADASAESAKSTALAVIDQSADRSGQTNPVG